MSDRSPLLDDAREAFIRYLRDRFGDEAADCRARDIRDGHEDGEEFIAGYLVALEDALP